MEGPGWYLNVKHATKDEWFELGPNLYHWGMFQFRESVERIASVFQALGLETKIVETVVDYDER